MKTSERIGVRDYIISVHLAIYRCSQFTRLISIVTRSSNFLSVIMGWKCLSIKRYARDEVLLTVPIRLEKLK